MVPNISTSTKPSVSGGLKDGERGGCNELKGPWDPEIPLDSGLSTAVGLDQLVAISAFPGRWRDGLAMQLWSWEKHRT